MPEAGQALARAFRAHVLEEGRAVPADILVVAVSGGLDSVVLAHLLRFVWPGDRVRLVAAHVDHAMRPDSDRDAAWVRGLAAAWRLELRATRLDPAPTTESEARRARYAFLERVRRSEGAAEVATAHHLDDQAETVLFRAARGSGLDGLSGIRRRREGVWRPLLPFRRAELRDYATAEGLSWREDPSNFAPLARNVLRAYVLPTLERDVAPGAARSLARLAGLAAENEAAWGAVLPDLLRPLHVRQEPDGGLSFDRGAARAAVPALRARLVRALLARFGAPARRAGTRVAVEFITSGPSGGQVDLGGGVTLGRDFDRMVLRRERSHGRDQPVLVPGPEPGAGLATLQGALHRVRWGPVAPDARHVQGFERSGLRYPLTVRRWRAGDRAQFPYGSKKLKDLFREAKVPRGLRPQVPVVVDADERVLWVPGVAETIHAANQGGSDLLYIGIDDGDHD